MFECVGILVALFILGSVWVCACVCVCVCVCASMCVCVFIHVHSLHIQCCLYVKVCMLRMKTHTFVSHSVCHRSPSNVSHLLQGGPRWEISRTPRKLIVVRDAHAESQSFGTAHTFYEVETKVWSTLAVCQVNADCLKLWIFVCVCRTLQ